MDKRTGAAFHLFVVNTPAGQQRVSDAMSATSFLVKGLPAFTPQ
jgi:hypothetical protein